MEIVREVAKSIYAEASKVLAPNRGAQRIHFKGCNSTFACFVLAGKKLSENEDEKNAHVFVAIHKESALYLYDTLVSILGEGKVRFLPDSFERASVFEALSPANLLMRSETLATLGSKHSPVIITYPEAIAERCVNPEIVQQDRINVNRGEMLDIDFIMEILQDFGFDRVDFVYEPGQYAIRGAIIDIFSYANEQPFRIQLDDDIVESIRIFEPSSQLSFRNVEQFSLLPNVAYKYLSEHKVPFTQLCLGSTALWIEDEENLYHSLENLENAVDQVMGNAGLIEEKEVLKFFNDRTFDSIKDLKDEFSHFKNIVLNHPDETLVPIEVLDYPVKPHPVINKNFTMLVEHLEEGYRNGYQIYFFSDSARQLERLESILKDLGSTPQFQPVIGSIFEGFIDHHAKIEILTDHQVFQRYHKFSLRRGYTRDQAITIRMLKEIQPGDFVTHIDHGVGRFSGLETIEVNGVKQESVRIFYKNNDLLYVSINSLHKLSKYVGKDGVEPQLAKLGSDTWKNLVNKTKRKIKDIAASLIKLYARRKASSGFAFSEDGYLQNELEASFIYEDTPDQYAASQDVKADMEKSYPMDRLICGDVGFGKTEVAIRAGFKAINDGKQVAILVPTTILALQHYHTFQDRLSPFGVEVNYLNRFKTAKEKTQIYQDLKSGKIDLIIGTHALLNKEIEFKDLGLLIIDEEQKFGVAAKEKIRHMKVNVDTLTMTATPIPRTLQFSLMAARDLSIIRTPPPNRQPIHTEIIPFNEKAINEAIVNEVARGGQVFFVHDRIKNLAEIANMIKSLIPDISVRFAHGQMDAKDLETTLVDFIEGKFDVLVSTNIIETGLDIPNANTMIINNAHHYGLSDLHQLRGRVGRSNLKAYCYLVAPNMHALTQEAKKRLKTIVDFAELGSGFEIAMRDLDIRGGGNLLGGEQSGFIAEIGYDAFQKILEEAIGELKEDDFKEVFDQDNAQNVKLVKDVIVETDTEMLIPSEYVTSSSERLKLYNDLDTIEDEDALHSFLESLEDRFGPIPKPIEELTNALRIRWVLKYLGFERLVFKNQTIKAFFPSNPQSNYYQSAVFEAVFSYLAAVKNENTLLKKTNKSLILQVNKVSTILRALDYFIHLHESIQAKILAANQV